MDDPETRGAYCEGFRDEMGVPVDGSEARGGVPVEGSETRGGIPVEGSETRGPYLWRVQRRGGRRTCRGSVQDSRAPAARTLTRDARDSPRGPGQTCRPPL